MINPQTANNYEELLGDNIESSPYEYDQLFKAEGWFARRRARGRFKLLKALDPKLRRLLQPDERVYFITTGTTVSAAEQFFTGWVAHYLNMRALVFTTQRVLLVQIDSRKRPRELVAQLPYIAIAEVKSTWTGACRLKLSNGRKLNFVSVPRADRKFLSHFLNDIVEDGGSIHDRRAPGIENLCPHCFKAVATFPASCPECHAALKSPTRAGVLSLIFPGLGDWYLGHRGFATMELLGSTFVWLALVILPLSSGRDADGNPIPADYWITVAIIITLIHVIDAIMTHHFGKKGLYPA